MKQPLYRDRDYAFGQIMLTLRSAMELTQAQLGETLSVSSRAVGDWEAGVSYPKVERLKQFIALAVRHQVFQREHEAEEIRELWKVAHQKVLLDEKWLARLLTSRLGEETEGNSASFHQTTIEQPAIVNLPLQTTPFIGRVAELSEIASILGDPACRLLTLLGPGGIGKTRLALEVAARQANMFTEGAVFVPLASVGTPDQILSAIGDSLKLSFAGQSDPAAFMLDFLRDQHMLLVLDNFEHLLGGANLVCDIIQHAPNITVLVTSRIRLDLQAEWLFDVQGLSYPVSGGQDPTDITSHSAIELFVQRARQVDRAFQLQQSTLATVVRVCQHVAGMPLAIELAAAGVRTYSVEEIEQQIHMNLDVLSTTMRDVPARHRSMRAVFDQSWNLLSEPERTLFSRLAVFRGGCTVQAAGQVAGATLPELMALVDKSLLRQVTEPNASSETRFLLLEPSREYAMERRMEHGDYGRLQHIHATYYLKLAEAAAAQWDSPTADAALKQLGREYNNLHAALVWSRDSSHPTIGLRIAVALTRFWDLSGIIGEGRIWLADLLALDDHEQDSKSIAARMNALKSGAELATAQFDFVAATQMLEESKALRQLLGETGDEPGLLINAALHARAEGQYLQATMLIEESLAQHRAIGDRGSSRTGGIGQSLYVLALVLREQGEFDRALAVCKECIDLHQEIGEREGTAQAQLLLGDIARDRGDSMETRKYSEASLAVFRELGSQWAIGFALNNLAQAAYLEANLPRAFTLASESTSHFRSIASQPGLAEALITQGKILRAQGEMEAAHDALTEALRLVWAYGPRLFLASALEGLAGVLVERGESLALQLLSAAAALRVQMGTPLRPADRSELEHITATAHRMLDDEAFEALWSKAKHLSLVQFVSSILTPSVDNEFHEAPLPPVSWLVGEDLEPSNSPAPATARLRVDWGNAVTVREFFGREWELTRLSAWVLQEHCRVIGLLGVGGIGKSALSVTLMHRVAQQFDVVIWRSLRDAPTCESLLDSCLQVLAPQPHRQALVDLEQRLNLLIEYLRGQRVLVILDNLETLFEEGSDAGSMRSGYESYERLISRVGGTEHQGCLLFTSREKPVQLVPLEGKQSFVRILRLTRLEPKPCEQLLTEKGVAGSDSERARLIEIYAGNPLALKIVAQTIVDVFGGEIAPFLQQGEIIFGGIRALVAEQFDRLSNLEQCIMLWLAIMREPTSLDELMAVMVTSVSRARLLEAIESLHRRSLIEHGQRRASFTLQSVVMEYMTARLVDEISGEIVAGNPVRLVEHGLELAQSGEYVRQTQARLLVAPILESLRAGFIQPARLEERLLAILDQWRAHPLSIQGYGPANLVALWLLLRGDLRDLNLSQLALRNVYLQGVEMQDAHMIDTTIQESVFTESFDAMTGVAIGSTGELWATSSRQGEIWIWEDGGHRVRHRWRGHMDMAWAIAFSPDERLLASGGYEGAVKVWDVASAKLLWFGWHTSIVNRVAFSPDGLVLASAGNDKVIHLWDVASGKLLETLPHPNPVASTIWHPDGDLLASGDMTGCVRVWTVNQQNPPSVLLTATEHTSCVDGLAFSPDGRILASASWDETVKLWGISSGSLLQTLKGHTNRVERVAWSPDGDTLASSSIDHTILLWDVKQNRYRAKLEGHTGDVYQLSFTPDSRNLLSGSRDGTLRVWDVQIEQCVRVIRGYAASTYDVDWSPDGSKLVSGGTDMVVTIWDVADGIPTQVLQEHTGVVCSVGFSPDGRWLASSESEHTIRLWDLAAGLDVQLLRPPDRDGNYMYNLAWSPNGQYLASGTHRRGVMIWHIVTGEMDWIGRRVAAWFPVVAWSPDGVFLACGGDDGAIYVWDVKRDSLKTRLSGHHSRIKSLAWSPDGNRLASGARGPEQGELFLWDVQSSEQLHSFVGHEAVVSAVVWDGSGERLISGDGHGKLCWWDVQNGQCLRIHQAHNGMIQSLRRSCDSLKLASCGDDGAITLWDLPASEYLQTLRRDRPYERLDITGIRGLNDAQKATLYALGAVEKSEGSTAHMVT